MFYAKHLFEAGTLGTKCNSQVIIPYKTQCYSDSADPPDKGIPLCTLKNFPYKLEHTIQWARDYFEGIFVSAPFECNQFLRIGKSYLTTLKNDNENQYELLGKLKDITATIKALRKASSEECVKMARKCFEDVHHDQIANLLYNFPLDHVNKET